jgi:hypothetical protein
MKRQGITEIVPLDRDFDRFPAIIRVEPLAGRPRATIRFSAVMPDIRTQLP